MKITLRCEPCQKLYTVNFPYSQKEYRFDRVKHLLARRLDFAVCPHCNAPRNSFVHAMYQGAWHCPHCGLPEPIVQKKGEYCVAAYSKHYYSSVVKPKRLLRLKNDEGKFARHATHSDSASPASEFL